MGALHDSLGGADHLLDRVPVVRLRPLAEQVQGSADVLTRAVEAGGGSTLCRALDLTDFGGAGDRRELPTYEAVAGMLSLKDVVGLDQRCGCPNHSGGQRADRILK